jgi:hypothetical protein
VTRLALVAIIAVIAPHAAAGQQAVQLAVLPVSGLEIHRVFQTRTTVALQRRDVESGAMEPPVFQETAQLGGMRQVIVTGVTGEPVMHLAFDSLISRAREAGGEWRELRVGGLDTLWVQVDVDHRMRFGDARTMAVNPGQGLLIDLANGLPGLELPTREVRTGGTWHQDIEMAIGAFAIRTLEGLGNTVSTRVEFTVDSIVPRARDTLAYMSFVGTFRAKVQHLDDGGVRRTSGGIRGALIWSSGWRTIVSESARTQIRVATHIDGMPDSPMRELGIVDTTVQTQVQPGT